MRTLILTWEFPPFISGGLGMACYGLTKALLSKGVEVDLILPTTEDVFFPLRRPEDADILPVCYLDPAKREKTTVQTVENIKERLKSVGVSDYPESYLTPAINFEKYYEWLLSLKFQKAAQTIDQLKLYLDGEESLFKKVWELTARAVKIATFLSFDVIHANDWLTYPTGMVVKNVSGKPMVSHIHATEFDRAGGPGDERIHKIEYSGLTNADLIIAVSQYTTQMIVDRYRIPMKKVRTVHNAYSLSPGVKPERRKLFKDPLILFLGRITIQKGPDYFVQVAERILRQNPNVRFVMAGTGDMFSQVINASASKRLKDRFLFAGFLNREQVERILAATDIFVLPSVSEPFGIVPLEAMAYGAVAIVSKQSGVSEVVENAFKVDFWDVDKTVDIINNLLTHPEELREMSTKGQNEVLSIGWEKAAENTINVYNELSCSA